LRRTSCFVLPEHEKAWLDAFAVVAGEMLEGAAAA
jgi:hypothetical protein